MHVNNTILAQHCINRQGTVCREDGCACNMCAQWRCADTEIISSILSSIALKDAKDGAKRRGIVEYYDLLMTSESLAMTFSTREAESRLMTAPSNQQTNLTRFEF